MTIGLRTPAERREVGTALLGLIEKEMRTLVPVVRNPRFRAESMTWNDLRDHYRYLHGLRRRARWEADWSPMTFMRADLERRLPTTSLPPDRHEEAWAPGEVMEAWGK
jgi:hypothetical protein